MVSAAILPDRAVLRISGEDARHFLQNLVTGDIEKLAPGEARFAALLTPQGKILFDFFVVAHENEFLLDAPKALASELAKRLRFYKLRAKVEIEETDLAIAVVFDGQQLPHSGIAFADPRHAELGVRVVLPPADTENNLRAAGLALVDAGEQADGDHRQDMIEAAERMDEAVHEVMGVAAAGMREGCGRNERGDDDGGAGKTGAHDGSC